MKCKTLIIERGARGGRLKKPLTIRVPQQQSAAEKKLLQYVFESLSRRSCLIPFALENSSTMKLARHLLFNRTGSQLSLYGSISSVYNFCRWIGSQPDQLVNTCRDINGCPNPKGIATMTDALERYIDCMQTRKLAPNTMRSRLERVITMFNVNGVVLGIAYRISGWTLFEDRAPSREELQEILDLADLRERVIITSLATSGLRAGTFVKLQFRHVKEDLERDVVPIHVHVEAALTKGKPRSFDTFFNEEASASLKSYLASRKRGTEKIPPEHIHDESPLVRADHRKQVKTVTVGQIRKLVHNLYVRAGILKNDPSCRRYELRTHSLRRFFRTQMASLGVDRDYIDYMMGRPAKDRYHDVRMKGAEYLRGIYLTSGISIRPKIKLNRIDALKEIIQSWGLDPQKILSDEALAQVTSTSEKTEANDRELLPSSRALPNHQSSGFLPEPRGAQK